MKHKTFQHDDDDTVICDMNVDGTPWHNKKLHQEIATTRMGVQNQQMTRSETRLYTWYSLLAGLVVVTVFSLGWVLFVLFCTEIWFR